MRAAMLRHSYAGMAAHRPRSPCQRGRPRPPCACAARRRRPARRGARGQGCRRPRGAAPWAPAASAAWRARAGAPPHRPAPGRPPPPFCAAGAAPAAQGLASDLLYPRLRLLQGHCGRIVACIHVIWALQLSMCKVNVIQCCLPRVMTWEPSAQPWDLQAAALCEGAPLQRT